MHLYFLSALLAHPHLVAAGGLALYGLAELCLGDFQGAGKSFLAAAGFTSVKGPLVDRLADLAQDVKEQAR